jgi:hypothetical protein
MIRIRTNPENFREQGMRISGLTAEDCAIVNDLRPVAFRAWLVEARDRTEEVIFSVLAQNKATLCGTSKESLAHGYYIVRAPLIKG